MEKDVELLPLLYTRADGRPNPFIETLIASGVSYQAIHVDASRWKYFNPLRNIRQTLAHLRAGHFDLVHTHGYRADLIGFIAARRLGIPIVSTCHGYISTNWHLRLYNTLDVYLLRHFNRVIAVSDQMKSDLVQRGVDEGKIRVVTNALEDASDIDTAKIRTQTRLRMGIAKDDFVFGFVGRLSEEKGLAYLLEALRQWRSPEILWRLVLVGDGPNRTQLERAVRAFDLSERVIFAGFQTNTAQWYSAMDAFVLPSLTEGTPMVLLEAMASSLPVIATSVGGVPAMISSGKNGLLVPPANPTRLLETLQAVAANADLRKRLSFGAVCSVRTNHGVAAWTKQMADIYTATLPIALRQCQ